MAQRCMCSRIGGRLWSGCSSCKVARQGMAKVTQAPRHRAKTVLSKGFKNQEAAQAFTSYYPYPFIPFGLALGPVRAITGTSHAHSTLPKGWHTYLAQRERQLHLEQFLRPSRARTSSALGQLMLHPLPSCVQAGMGVAPRLSHCYRQEHCFGDHPQHMCPHC